jgi:DNA mismatch repair protein MSH6
MFTFTDSPDSSLFETPEEPPSSRREFKTQETAGTKNDHIGIEEIDKLCKSVPSFINLYIHLYYEYTSRFDFPSWMNPKTLKDKAGRIPTDPEYDVSTCLVPRRNGKVVEEGHCTPMLQQYWDIKEDHFNEIILFKVGKFYELFYIDAAIAQSACNLKWMGNDRRAHVGFPEVSLQHHASLLINQGYTVCVVEQTETVSEANERLGRTGGALVERKICEVFTSGTLIHEHMMNTDTQYICAILISNDGLGGITILGDCATGQFEIFHITDNLVPQLKTILFSYSPREILWKAAGDEISKLIHGFKDMTGCVLTRWNRWEGSGFPNGLKIDNEVMEFVNANFLAKYCVSGITSYLDHLLLHDQVVMCSRWTLVRESRVSPTRMILDSTVLSHLEILTDSENCDRGSLLKLINQTKTKFGFRILRKWLCCPLTRVEEIEGRLNAVEFFITRSVTDMKGIREQLAQVGDLERSLQRICAQALQERRNAVFFSEIENKRISGFLSFLESICFCCKLIEKLHHRISRDTTDDDKTTHLLKQILDPKICEEILSICRDLKSKVETGNTGEYVPRKGAFAEYDEAVCELGVVENELRQELNRVKSDILGISDSGEAIFVSVKFKYEIEVPVKYESVLKRSAEPIDITSSRKGYIRFQTDRVKGLVDRLDEVEQKKKDLLYPFMSKLFGELNEKKFMFFALINRIGELDSLLSLAVVSRGDGWTRPKFGDGRGTSIILKKSRHPVQEFLMQLDREFIPNDIVIGLDATTLLVTGANMGGKSTILRQVCVNVILAQIGCFVPAESCLISSPIDRIFTRIGASDNILEGKSTFLTELEETAVMLKEATSRSLVVIDELGRGTSTFDGVAIAGATLDYITQKIGCCCLFATHYHRLADYATDRMQLFHMECLTDNGVVLTHKFKPGKYPHSQAMNVARNAGIPESILIEAENVSKQFHAIHTE